MTWSKVYYAKNEIDGASARGALEAAGIQAHMVPNSEGPIIKSPFFHTNFDIPYDIFVREEEREAALQVLRGSA